MTRKKFFSIIIPICIVLGTMSYLGQQHTDKNNFSIEAQPSRPKAVVDRPPYADESVDTTERISVISSEGVLGCFQLSRMAELDNIVDKRDRTGFNTFADRFINTHECVSSRIDGKLYRVVRSIEPRGLACISSSKEACFWIEEGSLKITKVPAQ